ncbi:MAG: hypothetical protein CVV33_03130 [Methanomicrobiales archaeon HGW-Methanomicrobiales-4]|nr:MAG: hypothetical protein CVV33_03130 [Methanomicrobiales archaeon HGW-Methanomicrobiales-4]
MPANYPAGRATEFEAKRILEREGYQVMRAVSPAPFDLIAWKNSKEILCLVVRRSKAVSISGYSGAVSELSELIKEGRAPGKCQFWIRYPLIWKRFLILPGGALLLEEGKDARDQICT